MPNQTLSVFYRRISYSHGSIDSYPPNGPPLTSESGQAIQKSKFIGTPNHYDLDLLVLRFSLGSIPAAATGHTFELIISGVSITNTDSREYRIDNYTWPGATHDYTSTELTGDAASGTVASFGGTIALADVTVQDVVSFRFGISGGQPTGLNLINFSGADLKVTYQFSPTPGTLSIDGDTANGKQINRADVHRFAWATGATSTRFILSYKRASSGSWTTVDQTTPNQFWDAPGATFTSAADNNWQWKVVSYNSEGTASPESETKTFTAVGSLANPVVSPSGTVTQGLLTITSTGSGTHIEEQFQVTEAGAVIYNTGKLVQATNSHVMGGGFFTNGLTSLEDGKSYVLHKYDYDTDGNIGHGTSNITVTFTPAAQPATPTLEVTGEQSHINIYYQTPQTGGTVTSADVMQSVGYDPVLNLTGYDPVLNPNAVFTVIPAAEGLEPSNLAVSPNYKHYEARHGELVYYRIRARSGMVYEDSEAKDATLDLPEWIWLHDPDDPEGTILHLIGHVEGGGGGSAFAIDNSPAVVAESFLNRKNASIDRMVTSTGELVRVRTFHVTVLSIVGNRAGMDDYDLKDRATRLLTSPKNLVLRTRDTPLGEVVTGGVTKFSEPSPTSLIKNRYLFAFDFVEAG